MKWMLITSISIVIHIFWHKNIKVLNFALVFFFLKEGEIFWGNLNILYYTSIQTEQMQFDRLCFSITTGTNCTENAGVHTTLCPNTNLLS